jgi:hypothetical protein
MSVDGLTEEWVAYRDAALRFYSVAGPFLREQRRLDGEAEQTDVVAAEAALEEVVGHSERLGEIALENLPEPDPEDHGYAHDRSQDSTETLLLAVAAVDAAVAYSALSVSPGAPAPEGGPEEHRWGVLRESPFDTIAVADWLFGSPEGVAAAGGGGGDPTGEELRLECRVSADRLIDLAGKPALSFSSGMLTGTVSAVLPAGGPLEVLGTLVHRAGPIKGHALKLVTSCLHKLVGLSGRHPEELAQMGVGCVEEVGPEFVLDGLRTTLVRALGRAAGRGAAEADIAAAIDGAAEVSPKASAMIRYEIAGLTNAYAQMMDRASTTAKWLSRASFLITALASPLVAPVLNGIGVGFVFYTLDVRLEGHHLPRRVAGLVTIVRRNL